MAWEDDDGYDDRYDDDDDRYDEGDDDEPGESRDPSWHVPDLDASVPRDALFRYWEIALAEGSIDRFRELPEEAKCRRIGIQFRDVARGGDEALPALQAVPAPRDVRPPSPFDRGGPGTLGLVPWFLVGFLPFLLSCVHLTFAPDTYSPDARPPGARGDQGWPDLPGGPGARARDHLSWRAVALRAVHVPYVERTGAASRDRRARAIERSQKGTHPCNPTPAVPPASRAARSSRPVRGLPLGSPPPGCSTSGRRVRALLPRP